jgi:MFS family permease
VVRRRNFAPFLAGNFLSSCGTWIQNLAQAVLVFRLTGSTLAVGVVGFAQFTGVFLMAPWSGSSADRYDRRRLLIVTQVWSMIVTGVLALLVATGTESTPMVIALVLLLGCANAFAQPALQSLVPLLVRDEELAPAVALSSLTFTSARTIGPVIAAAIIAGLGIAWAFGLNCLSFGALVLGLCVVTPRAQGRRPPGEKPKLSASLRLVRSNSRLLAIIVAIMATSFSCDPITTLSPAYAGRVFGHNDAAAGLLVGAYGLGSAIAGVTVSGRRNDPQRDMPVALLLSGLGIVALAFSPTMLVGMVSVGIAGLGFLWCNTIGMTSLMLGVEDSERGRIMTIWTLAFMGTRPLASLIDGTLGAVIGIRGATLVMSTAALGAALWLVASRTAADKATLPELAAVASRTRTPLQREQS